MNSKQDLFDANLVYFLLVYRISAFNRQMGIYCHDAIVMIFAMEITVEFFTRKKNYSLLYHFLRQHYLSNVYILQFVFTLYVVSYMFTIQCMVFLY